MKSRAVVLLVSPICVLMLLIVGQTLLRSASTFKAPTALASQQPLLNFELSLEQGERLAGAAAGDLTNSVDSALVLGTTRIDEHGRVHVLHRQGSRYREVWASTGWFGNFSGAIIQSINRQPFLITSWTNGQGGYVEVRIFKWDGRTYQEIWNLQSFEKGGQLTRGARLQVQRIDDYGNAQLVVRAPNVPRGESTLGALPRQVSIYRWDARKQTFALFKRYVDPQKAWE